MKRYIFLLLVTLGFSACQNHEEQVEKLVEEVMVVHDASMLKMDVIYEKIGSLRKVNEGMNSDSLPADPEMKAEILDAIISLQKADDGMMDWMKNYRRPAKGEGHEESLNYLEDQKKEIEAVDLAIDHSLENADKVLEHVK